MTRDPRFALLLSAALLGAYLAARVGNLHWRLSHFEQLTAGAVGAGAVHVLAIVGIQALIILRIGPVRLLLGMQAFLVLGPHLLADPAWSPYAGGALAAALVLTMSGRAAWTLFALVVIGEAAIGTMVYESADPGSWPATFAGFVFVNLNVGLSLFAVGRLTQLVQQAHRDRRELARAEADAERLRATRELSTRLGTRILGILRQTRTALAAPQADPAHIATIGDDARLAADDARSIATVRRHSGSAAEHGSEPAPSVVHHRFACWMLVAMTVNSSGVSLANLGVGWLNPTISGPALWVAAAATVLVAGALQVYHGTPRADGTEPRWWRWTLSAHLLLLTAAIWAAFGLALMPLMLLALGAAVVRIRPPWNVFLLGTAVVPIAALAGRTDGTAIYWGASVIATALSIYAMFVLPQVTTELMSTRAQLSRTAVMTERLRFGRDVHDLFGVHLSTIGLKAELAAKTLADDPAYARGHLGDIEHIAEKALAEIRSIRSTADQITVRDELSTAQTLLEAAGVQLTADVPVRALPRSADQLVGIIIREGATNIVRHATAASAEFTVHCDGQFVTVRIANDGVTDPPRWTRRAEGIANLTARVNATGGRVHTTAADGQFILSAELPLMQRRGRDTTAVASTSWR